MKNIFLVGYYGYKNIGDDLLLYEIAEYLKSEKKYNISALSFDAKKTSSIYGIQGVSRLKGLSIVNHIRSVDIVVYGGGSILQDTTSSKSLYYYMGIMFLAKLFGKKVYLLGNGYGPIYSSFNRKILDMLLKKVDGVIARDTQAYENFKSHNIKKLYKGVDCGFLGKSNASHGSLNTISKPYVIVSIRDWKKVDVLVAEMKKTIALLNDRGYDVYMLAMKLPEDDKIIRENFKENKKLFFMDRDIEMLYSYFENSSFTIGMRFHSLVLSALSNKPFVAIPYDPKVESFAKESSQPLLSRVENLKKGELEFAVNDIIDNYASYMNIVKEKSKVYKEEAKKQFKIFSDWIEE